MTFRPAPLRAGAALAAFFVVARVLYRVLFNGADDGGIVLLDLPAYPLPAPYSSVTFLGPVTGSGLGEAVLSALPIAAGILAFALLNSLVDVGRGFTMLARRGPLRGAARMLVVAWAALPALADAVRSVRLACLLRGERFGARALVPVLERTLEHASRVAAALELRGFAGAGVQPAYGPTAGARPAEPVLVEHATFGIGGTAITVPAFAPAPGTLTVLTGPTGSGKSTVLRGLAGLLSHVDGGTVDGTVRVAGIDRASVPPRDTAGFVGVVLQNPRAAFATTRVRDEIALALELRGVHGPAARTRVLDVAAAVGVEALLDRDLPTLSAGEATLVAIAAAVVQEPMLLLVDEPLADLDTSARRRVVAVLGELAHLHGVCVLVAEHRAGALVSVADAWWTLDGGVLAPGAASVAARSAEAAPFENVTGPGAGLDGDPLLTATGLSLTRHGKTLLRDASLDLHRGRITALVGPNGAGKSSFLVALALSGRHRDKELRGTVAGAGVRIALVPDASDDLFTRDTVGAELRAAARRAPGEVVESDAWDRLRLLRAAGRIPDAREHPRDLSAGERRILALTLQSLGEPGVLLIDEPTRGLDPAAREAVGTALEAAAGAGAAVLLATHDHDFARGLGARILAMRDGVTPVPSEAGSEDEGQSFGHEEPASTNQLWAQPLPSASRPVGPRRSTRRTWRPLLPRGTEAITLLLANLLAFAAFCWPLVATALPEDAAAATPYAALAITPLAAIAVVICLDGSVRSAHTVALLGVLAAVGSTVRVASTGVGGVEAVFILLILAGRAYGARFGLLLGAATIALSSAVWGGIGPWTPFQIFACAWVGAGAGLLPRRVRGVAELWMLGVYGVVASYLFGLLTNLWFWPFAVGAGTGISYLPGAPLLDNLRSFLLYSLLTSTAGWDTLRAVTTVVGIAVVGRAVLAALRRAKPVTAHRHRHGSRPGTASEDRTGRLSLTP
ncbi:energy-coupling factor transporter ATP-binding protein EcfA2 [Arthrobacter woluwensis]|uniref:ATP-binding cassette domain-containing protein n=1 Tax=Arthrobacter woluwensis TaxID=156980 RepID=UPI00277DA00F|nr:ATP-binding cassette domain-containing protein [Arthrobacter woluwensis]MDQ0708402.1 energy-coupling factor transporter ATP-binding protein EcfA2 [Arthrobacter woluwensis]